MKPKSKHIKKQSLEYYLNIQYPITIYSDTDGGYVAEIKDLPGCLTQGETLEETMENINEAQEMSLNQYIVFLLSNP